MSKGRPLKYANLLKKLDPVVLYTASGIADFACTSNYIRDRDPEQKRLKRMRIRSSCNRLAHAHEFPEKGDDLITIGGQHPLPAWYGRRWLDILTKKKVKKKRRPRK